MRNPRKVIRQKGIKGMITRIAFLLRNKELTKETIIKATLGSAVVSPFVGTVAAYADEAITPTTDSNVEYTQTAEEVGVTPSSAEPIISDTNVNELVSAVTEEVAPTLEQIDASETVSTEVISETTEGTAENAEASDNTTEEAEEVQTTKDEKTAEADEVKATDEVEEVKTTEDKAKANEESVTAATEVMPLAASDATPTSEQPPLDITSWIPGKADENGNYNMDKDTQYYVVTLKDGSTVIWTDFGKNGDSLGNPSQDLFLENLQNSLVKDPNFKFDKNSTTFVDGLGNVIIKTPQVDEKGNQVKMYPQVDANGDPVLDANGELIYDNPNPVNGFDPIVMFNENNIGTYIKDPVTGNYIFSPNGDKVAGIAYGQHTEKEYVDPETQDPKKPITPTPPTDEPTPPEDKTTPPSENVVEPVGKSSGRLAKTGDGVNLTAIVLAASTAAGLTMAAGYGYSRRLSR